jgi:hypothetical protein
MLRPVAVSGKMAQLPLSQITFESGDRIADNLDRFGYRLFDRRSPKILTSTNYFYYSRQIYDHAIETKFGVPL